MACPAVGLAVVAVDLHSLHLLYSLMKDKLSHHERLGGSKNRKNEKNLEMLKRPWTARSIEKSEKYGHERLGRSSAAAMDGLVA